MRFEILREVKLQEVIEINPKLSLKKGIVARKVGMEHIKEFQRKITGFELAEFKGGSKFQNTDTLFARITPCLENGKTAYVDILENAEIAFGSTEFLVLRAKKGQTDPKYVYYLSISKEFREIAIKSMTGSSGRQRVSRESLLDYQIQLPSLEKQKEIGETLSYFDQKIELNNSIITNLEELAQTLFKRWFVDFEFPNEEGKPYKSSGGKMVESELGMVPEGWEASKLYDVASQSKETFNPLKEPQSLIAHFSLPAFDSQRYPLLEDSKTIKSNKYIINENSIMFSKMNPNTPRTWFPNIIEGVINICSSEYVVLNAKNYKAYVYNLISSSIFNEFLVNNATGSTNSRQRIRPEIAMNFQFPFNESVALLYDKKTEHIIRQILNLRDENQSLKELSDTLLPRLLSGKIDLVKQ